MSIDHEALYEMFDHHTTYRVPSQNGQVLITNGEAIVAVSALDGGDFRAMQDDGLATAVWAMWENIERDADRNTHLLPVPLKTTGEYFDCIVLSVNGEMRFWQVQERYIEPFFRFPLPFLHPCVINGNPMVAVFDSVSGALLGAIAPTSGRPETKEPECGVESLLMLDELNEWHAARVERAVRS